MPHGANGSLINSSQSQPQGTDVPNVPVIIVTDFSQQEQESRPPADLLTISLHVPCQSSDGDEEERKPVTDSEISSLLSRLALSLEGDKMKNRMSLKIHFKTKNGWLVPALG
jgi:hypothetical protein